MMRLLIVDDEKLTREGIVASVAWETIGITEVIEADDGVNGLQMARQYQPDIVLCDVRMPRMDGIAMLERIEALYPDTPAIFMSGYSDKEYLKAAIQLKAINYIEKPIDPKEIEATVIKAVEQRQYVLRQKNAEKVHTNLAATQLAFQLTVPYNHCQEAVNALWSQFRQHYGSDKFKYVTTMIVKHEQLLDVTTDLTYIHKQIHDYLKPMHLHIIYSEKRDCHIVYHIYGTLELARSTLLLIAERLSQLFHEIGKYYIAIGNTVEGIQMVYNSYETAVILLQSSYFFQPGYVLSTELIQAHKTVEVSVLSEISEQYTLRVMDKERKQNQLLPDFSIENHDNIMDIMQSCFSYESLHQLLKEKTAVFFDDLSQLKPENATIYMIRDYINNNYMNANLSVKDIGDYVNLSVSYLCTFFKNSTGVTLNQYITEFRVERAKQLLADSRYRITDISSAVGYSDGNYFSKSFRKYMGLSPSEFREKALR